MKDVGRPGSLHGLPSRDLDSFCAGDVGPTQARIVQILDALNHHHPTTPPPHLPSYHANTRLRVHHVVDNFIITNPNYYLETET